MAEKQLKFLLYGEDKTAGKALADVGTKSGQAATKIGAAFSTLGSKIGGEFGDILDTVGSGFQELGEHGTSMGTKLIATGAAVTGLGAALTAAGNADAVASAQLDAAITASGHSVADFTGQIDDTVSSMENYGHSASDTKNALRELTQATNSPEKAIEEMGVTANLAAAQHVSLGAAALLVSRILGGSGSRTLKQYGITMSTTGDKTTNANAALDQLAIKLNGQAAAAAHTFTGRLDAIKTKLGDATAEIGMKFGPALTAVGPVILGLGAIMETGMIQKLGKAAKGWVGLGSASVAAGEEAEASAATASEAVTAEAVATDEATEAMSLANPIMAGLAVGALALGAAFLHSRERQQEAKQTMDDYTAAVTADGGAVGLQTQKLAVQKLAASGVYDTFQKLGISQSTVTAAALGNVSAQQKLKAANEGTTYAVTTAEGKYGKMVTSLSGVSSANAKAYIAVINTSNGIKKNILTVKEQQAANASLKPAVEEVGISLDKTTAKMQKQNDAAGLLTAALNRLDGNAMSEKQAQLSFLDAVSTVTSGLKDNGKSLDDNTAKGRANYENVLNAITAANEHAEAVAKSTRSTKDGTAALRADEQKLIDHAAKAGLDKAAVQRLVAEYGRIPKVNETELELRNFGKVEEEIEKLTDSRILYINPVIRNGSGGIANGGDSPHAAGGTEYSLGGRYLVGENGPEFVDMPRGSKVTQNNRMKHVAGAGGGDTINVVVNVAGSIRSDNDVVSMITTSIAAQQRKRGKVTIYGGQN